MKRIIVWSEGEEYQWFVRAITGLIRLLEKVAFIGVTGWKQVPLYINNKALPVIPLEKLSANDFDYVLIAGETVEYLSVVRFLTSKGIDEKRIILDRVAAVPNFSFQKYEWLKKLPPSIFVLNCFGGLLYNRLGLPFQSPFINMFESSADFLKFLQKPADYLNKELKLLRFAYEANLEWDYPVWQLDDIVLNMNHYGNMKPEEAKQKWEERIKRINWYNLLVIMYTDNMQELEMFDKLPFAKKICFVPFETEFASGWCIPPEYMQDTELWKAVNSIGAGIYDIFDIWDMLLYGKRTVLKKNK